MEIKKEFSKNDIKGNIDFLFDQLWTRMNGRELAREKCYENIDTIVNKFKIHQKDFDKLLASLTSLEGIGLVIASGLIFMAFPNDAVPFDKYTMGYSLRQGILRNNKISGSRYSSACKEVVRYIDNTQHINDIWGFVRAAGEAFLEEELLIGPK